jgi:NhaP-type Na+/H+ or K+/H+ antiporter
MRPLTLCFSLSYVLASSLHMSGVMAVRGSHVATPPSLPRVDSSPVVQVLFCGVTMSHYTQHNLSLEARAATRHIFEAFAYTTNIFLFAYIGFVSSSAVFPPPGFFPAGSRGLGPPPPPPPARADARDPQQPQVVLNLVARGVHIFSLSFIVNQFRSSKIKFRDQIVLWFSGLRGIITFALALNVPPGSDNLIVPATLLVRTGRRFYLSGRA